MAAKATHKVKHPKFYMMHEGKMKKLEVGTPLPLTNDQAEFYGAKVEKIVAIPTLEVATPTTDDNK